MWKDCLLAMVKMSGLEEMSVEMMYRTDMKEISGDIC